MFRATVDYRLALLLEAPRGNTESAIADVTTVAVKVECVLKVPFVARLRRALPIGFWRWLSRLQVCDAVEQMVGHSAGRFERPGSINGLTELPKTRARLWIGKGPGSMKSYHETRLPYDERRNRLWKTLCEDYFQRFIGPEDCVLELGAGYGHFINHIRSKRRIAIDSWAGMTAYLQPGIEAHVCSVTELEMIENESVDFAFASNLFEHLTQEQFAQTLRGLTVKLKRGGTLNILQPNYRYAYREYFDDYTHVAVYSDRSLADFLCVNGFEVKECHARFLPLTIKSRMPVSAALIRLYLALPVKPMGKQMLLRAVRLDHSAA